MRFLWRRLWDFGWPQECRAKFPAHGVKWAIGNERHAPVVMYDFGLPTKECRKVGRGYVELLSVDAEWTIALPVLCVLEVGVLNFTLRGLDLVSAFGPSGVQRRPSKRNKQKKTKKAKKNKTSKIAKNKNKQKSKQQKIKKAKKAKKRN